MLKEIEARASIQGNTVAKLQLLANFGCNNYVVKWHLLSMEHSPNTEAVLTTENRILKTLQLLAINRVKGATIRAAHASSNFTACVSIFAHAVEHV